MNIENIVEPNEQFDFSKISLAHPVGIQGGAYFTKIENNKKKLHVQTCKSQSRQGFVKTGKKYYMDLMFDKNAEELIQWFENLEVCCRKLIFEKKNTWFQNDLEESDIESAFNSPIKIYKSGKFYLLRTNIKNNHKNSPEINIYNEQEIPLSMDNVTQETNIISILEIQGIKFTTRNFQIEIELKQILVLDDDPQFDKCLIKINKPSKVLEPIRGTMQEVKEAKEVEELEEVKELEEQQAKEQQAKEQQATEQQAKEQQAKEQQAKEQQATEQQAKEHQAKEQQAKEQQAKEQQATEQQATEPITTKELSLEIEEIEELDNIEENTFSLKEVDNIELDLDLEENQDTLDLDKPMQLKKPNQVYFNLYKEARNKAKQAKKNAIIAYLEAKNIKKTYMIEDLIDSDSDFDAEIDDVSESELEDL
jgi:hypothetical protein